MTASRSTEPAWTTTTHCGSNHAKVRDADPDDLDAVRDLLTEAFLHGDLASWVIGQVDNRQRILLPYFEMLAEHAIEYGQVEITDDAAAVALWFTVASGRQPGIIDYEARLREITGQFHARFEELDRNTVRDHPGEPWHQHLALLAVHPEARRASRASKLLTPTTPNWTRQASPRSSTRRTTTAASCSPDTATNRVSPTACNQVVLRFTRCGVHQPLTALGPTHDHRPHALALRASGRRPRLALAARSYGPAGNPARREALGPHRPEAPSHLRAATRACPRPCSPGNDAGMPSHSPRSAVQATRSRPGRPRKRNSDRHPLPQRFDRPEVAVSNRRVYIASAGVPWSAGRP
jgi:hypothetical protein